MTWWARRRMPPMRSRTRAISAVLSAAPTAIRSNGPLTVCSGRTPVIRRSVWWMSSRRSTFRWPCGPGTPRWHWSAAIRWCGSLRRRRRCQRWPVSRSSSGSCAPTTAATTGAGCLLSCSASGTPARHRSPTTGGPGLGDRIGAMGRAPEPLGHDRPDRATRLLRDRGGNKAMIVAPSADLYRVARADTAIWRPPGPTAASSTAGGECWPTSTRRRTTPDQP